MTTKTEDLAVYNLPDFTREHCPPPLPLRASIFVKNPLQNGHVITSVAPYSEVKPLICHYNDKKVVLQRMINLFPANRAAVQAPRMLPVVCGTIDLPYLNSRKIDFMDNTNKGWVLFCSMDREWKEGTLSVVDLDSDGTPITTGANVDVKTTTRGLLGNVPLAMAEICSFKGRMFVITDDAVAPQVHVLDYVLPSE